MLFLLFIAGGTPPVGQFQETEGTPETEEGVSLIAREVCPIKNAWECCRVSTPGVLYFQLAPHTRLYNITFVK